MIDPFIPTLAIAAGFGAIIGSFLNVVIHRVPAQIEHQAQIESGAVAAGDETPEPDGIVFPGSRCPACGAAIRGYDNIPVLSWLLLRGRARCCGAAISPGYPVIELSMAVLMAVVVALFGLTPYAGLFAAMTALLLAMSVIDAKTQYLPDALTLSGLWLGLLASLLGTGITPEAAIVGAAVGYSALWSINAAYRALRGIDGLGYGDFKLFALIGAWGGIEALSTTLLVAPFAALLVVAIRVPREGLRGQAAIPFGPYLALAGWFAVITVIDANPLVVHLFSNIGILRF